MEGLYALSLDVMRHPTSTFSVPFPTCFRCYCLTCIPCRRG